MKSGSTSYSPDYNSPLGRALGILWHNPRLLELLRLEREVIEKAKAERIAEQAYSENFVMANWVKSVETRQARSSAVDALLAFEAEQEKKS